MENADKLYIENPQNSYPTASRLTAKAALQELIRYKREELEGYEALLPIIPDDLTPEQDTALWRMIINLRG